MPLDDETNTATAPQGHVASTDLLGFFELLLDTALVFVGICIGAICNLWRRDAPSSED